MKQGATSGRFLPSRPGGCGLVGGLVRQGAPSASLLLLPRLTIVVGGQELNRGTNGRLLDGEAVAH